MFMAGSSFARVVTVVEMMVETTFAKCLSTNRKDAEFGIHSSSMRWNAQPLTLQVKPALLYSRAVAIQAGL